ncbi:MAG: DUF1801 domain-containing protein [Psychromonas sp.]|nr:DUF1801 domain-containing protein [Psychromonas sp.]
MELSVQKKFDSYPSEVKPALLELRNAILLVASEHNINDLQETLKWGEPSYVNKSGGTVRFDWKAKYPKQYCLYFNCKTSLIETFKELYDDTFQFEGNRSIVLAIGDDIAWPQLKHCISLSLRYRELKHLPLLGA